MGNNYDELEGTIGNVGGLGKLKNKESYGQKPGLDEEEKASLKAFRKAAAKVKEGPINISDGWVPIDRAEMGDRSQFYPEDWQFFVKSASVGSIKNWMAVDDSNIQQLNNVMNEILRTGIKIESDSGAVSWENICSWDRFWFIMKIREVTFSKGENSIKFIDECSECSAEVEFELTSEALIFDCPDRELVDKYWDGKCWKIDPKEYDVNAPAITLYEPTLGKDSAIIEWARVRANTHQKIDETFITYLPWLMSKPTKDPMQLDKQIAKIYKDYKNWDVNYFDFISDVIVNLSVNPSDKLKATCPACGGVIESNVTFQSGIKQLFYRETQHRKFGSRS